MTYCTNCNSTEPKTRVYTLDGEDYLGCAYCESEEDTLININEDDPNEDR